MLPNSHVEVLTEREGIRRWDLWEVTGIRWGNEGGDSMVELVSREEEEERELPLLAIWIEGDSVSLY